MRRRLRNTNGAVTNSFLVLLKAPRCRLKERQHLAFLAAGLGRSFPAARDVLLTTECLRSPPGLLAFDLRPRRIEHGLSMTIDDQGVGAMVEHERHDPVVVKERFVVKQKRRSTVIVNG